MSKELLLDLETDYFTYEIVEGSEFNCTVTIEGEGLLFVDPHDSDEVYGFELLETTKITGEVFHHHWRSDEQIWDIFDEVFEEIRSKFRVKKDSNIKNMDI